MDQLLNRSLLSRRSALRVAAMSAGVVVAGAAVSSASAGAASQGPMETMSATGQQGIVVTGNGQAEAPVNGAILQFLFRFAPYAPQLSDYVGKGMTPSPDEDALANIVSALIAVGMPRENIELFIGSETTYGPFGSGISVVGVNLDDIDMIGDLDIIVQAAADAGTETNLTYDQVGAVFTTEDCSQVSDDALADAVTDAREQGEALARALGVALGDLVGATSSPVYSPSVSYGPSGSGCGDGPTLDDAGVFYFPSFIAGSEPVFTMTASVTLTFGWAGED